VSNRSTPQRPAEIRALSGARAFPPLVLVLFHFCEGHGYRGNFWFDALVAKGYLWVEFFFALSGFILVHVYGERVREFWRGRAFLPFVQARLARLYPLHLTMLFVILGLVVGLRALAAAGGYLSIYDQPYPPMNTLPSFIANLFLVQAWNMFHYLSWNGASWFVSVEFLLCLLFPLYLIWAKGGVVRALIIIAVGASVLAAMSNYSGHGLDITYHNGIFRGMAGFGIGVGLAMLFRIVKAWGLPPLPEGLHSLAQIALLLLLLDGIYRTDWAHRPADIWTVLPMDAFVFLLAFDRGIVARALQTRMPQKLGEWSYAIYMGQTAWLQLIRFLEQRVYPPADTMILGWRWVDFIWWLEPLALLCVCIAWGALLAIAIEHPANAWLRRRIVPAKA
jgi:peptidoglycan/LPS O-acetylase OafA/YrhL